MSSAVSIGTLLGAARSASAKAEVPGGKLRILILGGTGFTGPHQVRYALARGHEVTVFNRGRQPVAWPGKVEELIGDRSTGDLKSLEGRTWDVCIDNPTSLPFWVRDAGKILAGNVKHYIFISTMSVYAKNDTPADETAPTAAYTGKDALAERAVTGELYGPLKAESEKEAKRQFGDHVTVIRPGLIVGPGDETDRFTYWPVRLSRGGEIAAPGDGSEFAQIIDARDLGEWTVRMAEKKELGTFNATGPASPMRFREMLAKVADGVGVTPQLTWVPSAFLKAQNIAPWSDMPVFMPAQGEYAGFARRDVSKAIHAGLTYRPLTQTSADTLAWFKTLPPERQAKLKSGLTPEKERALLDAWHAKT
jgi:2'-hydroxyisoflavone reductase